LRKLLGKGAIATLSHRGYRFVAPVNEAVASESARARTQEDSAAAPPSEAPPSAMSGSTPDTLPRALTKLVGRVRDVDRVDALLGGSRLITVAGAGGIGKTRLALAVADRVRQRFPDGVWLADLGPLDDAGLVPTAIASALGIQISDSE